MATATAIMPAPSTNVSTPRSLAATSLTGTPPIRAAREALDRRRWVSTSRTPRITSSARPMTAPSCRSGPFHRGVVTAPRSPASPRMTSSVSGRTSGQDGPEPALGPASGVPVSPVVPGPVVPGWLVIASRFLTLTDSPTRPGPHLTANKHPPAQNPIRQAAQPRTLKPMTPPPDTIYLIRHGEKPADPPRPCRPCRAPSSRNRGRVIASTSSGPSRWCRERLRRSTPSARSRSNCCRGTPTRSSPGDPAPRVRGAREMIG